MAVKLQSLDQHQNPLETCEKSEFSGPHQVCWFHSGDGAQQLCFLKAPPQVTMRHAQVCLGALIWYQVSRTREPEDAQAVGLGAHSWKSLDLQKPSSKSRYWVLAGTYCNTPVRKVSPHPPQSATVLLLGRVIHHRDCGTFVLPSPWGSISGQHTVFISWPAITNDPRPGGLTQQGAALGGRKFEIQQES